MSTAYDYIAVNKRKSRILAALFPVSLLAFAWLAVFALCLLFGALKYWDRHNLYAWDSVWTDIQTHTFLLSGYVLPACLLFAVFWLWQAFKQGDQMVLGALSGLRPLARWEAFDPYTALENLCLSTGDFLPELYVLEDDSMNAFSVGMRPEKAAIVVSSGLLKKLSRPQLEAVFAHELAHIRSYDVRVMVMLTTCLAFFTFAGEDLYRSGRGDWLPDKWKGRTARPAPLGVMSLLFMYAGAALKCYGYFVAPLMRFALSRAYEFRADADAALMTRNPGALSKALWRVSEDCRIEALDELTLVGAMCIARPYGRETLFERLSGIGRTHPPLEERMLALNDMDGLFLDKR